MKEHSRRCRRWLAAAATVTAALVLAGATQAQGPGDYVVHNLVSDQPGLADHTDPPPAPGRGPDRRMTVNCVEPVRRDLRLALDRVLAGQTVPQPWPEPVGCLIPDLPKKEPSIP